MFKGTLKTFQQEAVDFCKSNPYTIMNLEAGLGKTISALNIAVEHKKTLIVVPAYLKANWIREINKFTEGLNYTLTSYRSVKKVVYLGSYDCVIVDESHYLKNKEAQRTKFLHAFLKHYKPKKFIQLTGTPVSNRVSDFWSLLQLCYYGGNFEEFKEFNNRYYHFCNHFSYERSFDVNGATIVRFDGIRKNKIKELQSLVSKVLVRKKAVDCLDLPPENEIDVVGNSKKYDEQLRESLELFNANINDPAYMSMKSSNALAKVDDTYKLACELIEQGHRPLIFTCHIASAKALSKKLNTKYITGEVVADKRQCIIDDFNDKKLTSLVATIGSTSTGFNITSTNYTIFNDYDFVPSNMEQAKKRTSRIGQTKKCFYYYILTSEFDQKLKDMILRKSKDINLILDKV